MPLTHPTISRVHALIVHGTPPNTPAKQVSHSSTPSCQVNIIMRTAFWPHHANLSRNRYTTRVNQVALSDFIKLVAFISCYKAEKSYLYRAFLLEAQCLHHRFKLRGFNSWGSSGFEFLSSQVLTSLRVLTQNTKIAGIIVQLYYKDALWHLDSKPCVCELYGALAVCYLLISFFQKSGTFLVINEKKHPCPRGKPVIFDIKLRCII